MAHGKSLELREIQVVRLFTPNPSLAKRMSLDASVVTKYPDGSKYIWHNGSRRKATPFVTGLPKPIGYEDMDI